jgi:hypothetical protein
MQVSDYAHEKGGGMSTISRPQNMDRISYHAELKNSKVKFWAGSRFLSKDRMLNTPRQSEGANILPLKVTQHFFHFAE